MSLAVRCQNLRKVYPARPPVTAVDGLDLEIQPGECFGLLGPNGAGKTTTIEILEGLLPPTAGDVEVLGHRWGVGDEEIKQRIGIALQETKLPEKLTVLETLRLFRSFYRQGPTPEAVMARVSLEEKAGSWVRKLSGGQRQRLGVACALVGDPDLLFLDEPTTGLDPQSRRQLWDIIREFGRQGRTVLLTTHYMDEAERLCDRVGIVDRGKMIACDTPRQLIASLGGEHVVEFSLAGGAELVGAEWLADLPALNSAQCDGELFRLTVAEPHVALPALLNRIAERHAALASLTTRHASLEDVFVTLTGRHLTGDEAAEPAAA